MEKRTSAGVPKPVGIGTACSYRVGPGHLRAGRLQLFPVLAYETTRRPLLPLPPDALAPAGVRLCPCRSHTVMPGVAHMAKCNR